MTLPSAASVSAPTDGCNRPWFFGERNRPGPVPVTSPMDPGFSGAVISMVPGPKVRLTPDLIAMRKAQAELRYPAASHGASLVTTAAASSRSWLRRSAGR